MKKIKLILLVVLISAFCKNANAINKYAFIIGINNYYDTPGNISSVSLHGCVNDALSIKSLLINHYLFSQKNITTLLDSAATKEHLINGMLSLLHKCKAGDEVVFFYSGHGVYIENDALKNDFVKHGFNQALLMSNMYAPNYGSLFTDQHLKTIFNAFVDKKIILTTLFDCCYSLNAAAGIGLNPNIKEVWQKDYPTSKNVPSISIHPLPFINLNKNPFASTDSLIETNLRKVDKQFRNFHLSDDDTDNKIDTNLKVNNAVQVPRPYERINSKFLSFAACTDVEKSLEIKDGFGNSHGAFTKSLIDAINKNGVNTSSADLLKQINTTLQYQSYWQNPGIRCDTANRFQQNILGINSSAFKDGLFGKPVSKIGDTVVLNLGFLDAVYPGNIFKQINITDDIQLKVVSSKENNSKAIIYKGNITKVSVGNSFKRIDAKVNSSGLIKIYIPNGFLNKHQFDDFMQEKLEPLLKLDKYIGFNHYEINGPDFEPINKLFLNDTSFNTNELVNKYLSKSEKENFFPFIPIPTEILNAIKTDLQTDQNIQLVNSYADADYTLYLNKEKQGDFNFNFSFQNFYGDEIKIMFQYYNYFYSINNVPSTNEEMKTLTSNLHQLLKKMIRDKTNTWLNDSPR